MLEIAERPSRLALYEMSYRVLCDMVPDVRTAICNSVRTKDGRIELGFIVVERSKYTTTVVLNVIAWPYREFVDPVVMKVRLYHDAEVAEVMEFQGKGKFRSFYEYPNPAMYLPDEKRQTNKFLLDLLLVCWRCGIGFPSPEPSLG